VNVHELKALGVELLTRGEWTGWVWSGKKWVRVCVGDGLGPTSALLTREADARGIPDGKTCLTRGGAPSWTPNQRKGQA
jgi:hypothetical protein